MAMKNISFLITLWFLTFINGTVFSQLTDGTKFRICSLENKEFTLQVKPDVYNEKITITLNPKETLCINGYSGFDHQIKVLNGKFIELHFRMRGGSGVAIRRYVLVCVSGVKLYKPIDVLSLVRSEFKETYVHSIDSLNLYDESSLFSLKFNLLQDHVRRFKLYITQSEEIISKYDPSRNHLYKDSLELKFDENCNVFYNQVCNLNGYFNISSDDGSSREIIFKGEKYPAIKLRNAEYYYINKKWFIRDQKNHLSEFSDSCK